MKYYEGLDGAMKETFICILDEEGQKVFESQACSDPKPIHDELSKSGWACVGPGQDQTFTSLLMRPWRRQGKESLTLLNITMKSGAIKR